jgi:diguanylate cyclase (GGDEF)-like protein
MGNAEILATAPVRMNLRASGLPDKGRRFFACVLFGALVAAAAGIAASQHVTSGDWREFAVLAAGAALAQYFVVHMSNNQVFHVAVAFTVAAALALPPRLIVLLCVIQHLSDWAKERYPWYIQAFNISNYLLGALAAHSISTVGTIDLTANDPAALARGVAACAVFITINHVLLAGMLSRARDRSPRESGLFSFDSLLSDGVLALFGLTLAILWDLDQWAVLIVLPPLVLIQRALTVPQLWAEARTDAKTGLFNARHFGRELAAELRRASRFRRPVSVVMADLDLLRAVNNKYGHLAGDAVLRGVADVVRRELRDYDTPARFGGDEFAILLPETGYDAACAIAERIRTAVATSDIPLRSRPATVRVAISVGVSTFPDDGATPETVLDAADTALYRAKLNSRNDTPAPPTH